MRGDDNREIERPILDQGKSRMRVEVTAAQLRIYPDGVRTNTPIIKDSR